MKKADLWRSMDRRNVSWRSCSHHAAHPVLRPKAHLLPLLMKPASRRLRSL